MATIKTAVDIDIKVDGQTSVQQAATAYEDLGDAVSTTQLEAEKLAQQFGINDARTKTLKPRLSNFRERWPCHKV